MFAGVLAAIVCAVLGFAAWTAMYNPAFASILAPVQPQPQKPLAQENMWAQVEIAKPLPASGDVVSELSEPILDAPTPSEEPSAASSESPSLFLPTETPAPAPIIIEPTSTPEVIETPAQLSMEIIPNTPTPEYVPLPTLEPLYSSKNGERWIDVDLTNQRTYAYEGDTIVNSFIVSTGTWLTPTVTGKYRVYLKYESAKMSGPGYYLPNVPYIMYFYGSYGLHGTYWHNNFGTPMSHGCVNLRTEDAHWLFDWASIGTVVNVHY